MSRPEVRALVAAQLLGPVSDKHNTFTLRSAFRSALRAADLLLAEAANDGEPSHDAPPTSPAA